MKSSRVTIELNAMEQYFPVVLFIKRYKVFLTFWVRGWNTEGWPFKRKLLSSILLCVCQCFNFFKFNVNKVCLTDADWANQRWLSVVNKTPPFEMKLRKTFKLTVCGHNISRLARPFFSLEFNIYCRCWVLLSLVRLRIRDLSHSQKLSTITLVTERATV